MGKETKFSANPFPIGIACCSEFVSKGVLFVRLFEWTPSQRKGNGYLVIREFTARPGLALIVTPNSRPRSCRLISHPSAEMLITLWLL